MSDQVHLDMSSRGGVLLPEEPTERMDALASGDVRGCVRRWPDFVAAWAELGDSAAGAGDEVEAYAFYRVGYHRSLDSLRRNGWRGAGRVPYSHPPNQAFHRCVAGLMRMSAAFGDADEVERLRLMLLDSDPSNPLGA